MKVFKKFTEIERPFLVSSLRSESLDYVIKDIAESQEGGAQAFLLHIELLSDKYKNAEDIGKIINSAKCPVMALNYRTEESFDDEKLADLLIKSVKVGARAVDIWANMFDYDSLWSLKLSSKEFTAANPKEITMQSDCIEMQKRLIKEIKSMGAEVLMSAHVGVELSCGQAISLAKEMESRGADIVKIITTCNSYNQALKILQTAAELKNHLKVPYLYQCGGIHGKLTRLLAPLFGSMMVLCHQKYSKITNPEKPLILDAKNFYNSMKWRMEN